MTVNATDKRILLDPNNSPVTWLTFHHKYRIEDEIIYCQTPNNIFLSVRRRKYRWKEKKNLKDSTNGNPQNLVDIVNSDVEIHKNALATTQSNERNPSRSRSKFLLPSSLPFSPLISPHGWTKDGPIARFIATLKRTYLLWSRCSRGKSSWPLNFETSLRVQARIGRNRCTSFPNAPTLLPFVHQSPFVFNFLANLYAFPRLVKWKRNSREF